MAKAKEVAILFDSSHCTGCKGCQVACKQWNMLPSPMGLNENKFTGSYQSPMDLNGNTRLIMTFDEKESGNKFQPLNFAIGRRSCYHCTDAALRSALRARSTTRKTALLRLIPTSATAARTASRPAPLMCRASEKQTAGSISAPCALTVWKKAGFRPASRPASPRL